MGSPCPVAIRARRLDWMKNVQASKQTSKHSYAGTRPRWLKRISVPSSVAEISKTIRVSFHSAWSSMKLIQLSSTCQTTRRPGISSVTRIWAVWTFTPSWLPR
jgi:hypothetical protein